MDDKKTWVRFAACKDVPTEVFYPPTGTNATAAKKICAKCLVSADCLQYAMDINEKHGFWGNMSERGRRALRSKRAADRKALQSD